jgi:tetratricopeptide (TPR) repeat protein|tara:strand:- start:140 stop:1156 length:1017 start_codon:yes stop_codon:yes gene_type:complete
MKILPKIFIFILSSVSIYFHYINNVSSEIQADIYQDIFSGEYREESTRRFGVLNTDFPNLSLSSLPMKGVIGRYYYLGAQYDKALELANQGMKDNPYIMYNESLKTDIYFRLGVKDSMMYYAERAFSGIPNNNKHFLDLARAYVNFDKYKLLDSVFKVVEDTKDPVILKFYFSSLLTKEDSISKYAKEKAREALKNFPESSADPNLRLSAAYVLYGTERIQKAIAAHQKASDLYDEGKFRESALKYEEASKLNPLEYTYFENAGITNFQFGYYEKAIPFLKHVIDSINPRTGKSELVLAQVYNELGDLEKACKYISASARYNYQESFKLIGVYCIDKD